MGKVKRIKSAIILWLMSTALYRWMLKHVIPYVRFTTYYASMRGGKYHEGYAVLKTGHIILTNDRKKLTSLLIPGMFSHAALCVGRHDEGDLYEIAEMTHSDYTKSWFFDLCKEADRVVILKCIHWGPVYSEFVAQAAISLQNAKYDTDFCLGVEALYCSELVVAADNKAARELYTEPKLRVDYSDLAGLGRPYISPTGLLFAPNVICEWDSDNEFTGLTGPEIERMCHG